MSKVRNRVIISSLMAILMASQPVMSFAEVLNKPVSAEIETKGVHNAVQSKIEEVAQKYGASGVEVAIIKNGQVADTFSYGWSTKGVDPMTTDTKIRIASISKVILGMETMRLREKGVVNLDTSIGEYWGFPISNPNYPQKVISIRSLLSHTSSIDANLGKAKEYEVVSPLLQNGQAFDTSVPNHRHSWSYNNYAFDVLGLTIEQAANKSVDEMLREDFYTGMDIDGAFFTNNLKNTDNIATLYNQKGDVERSVEEQKAIIGGFGPKGTGEHFAGGMEISVSDLAKLVALLANDGMYDGKQYLSPQSVAMLEATNIGTVGDGFYQALPLRYRPNMYGRDRLYYHTGSAYGVYNTMSYDPGTKDGVVVLSIGAEGKKDDYGVYRICGEISEYIYNFVL